MGIPVLILGESGSGKSASLRNFDEKEIGIFNACHDIIGSIFSGKRFVFRISVYESCRKTLFAALEFCVDRPVFFGFKRLNFAFSLADHGCSDALHAAAGKAFSDLAPKKRTDFIADKAVEHTARLLSVDEVHV